MFYVYILKLNNGQLYTGYTADLRRRFSEHQAGKSAFTSARLPVELIHYEAYKLESDARRFVFRQHRRGFVHRKRHSPCRGYRRSVPAGSGWQGRDRQECFLPVSSRLIVEHPASPGGWETQGNNSADAVSPPQTCRNDTNETESKDRIINQIRQFCRTAVNTQGLPK